MATIYDPLPLEVLENLAILSADLDEKIPSKELDRNLLIASWNIRAFGNLTRKWWSDEKDSPRRDLHSIYCIAEILSRFDVIAVQEVKANLRASRYAETAGRTLVHDTHRHKQEQLWQR